MNSRTELTRAILLTELLLLVGAIVTVAFWAQSSVSDGMADQALADNHLVAEQMGRLIDDMGLHDLSMGSDDWAKLQEIVTEARLPNDGYLCVTGSDSGKLICHPDLRKNPALREFAVGQFDLDTGDSKSSIVNEVSKKSLVRGRAQMGSEVHLVAARRLEGVHANLMVHQSLPAIRATAAERVRPVYWIGGTVALGLLGVTGLACSRLLRNYDLHLERLNTELEGKVVDRTRSLMKTRNAVILGLAQLSESRDTDTGEHLDRISGYSTALATALREQFTDIDDEFVETIGFASSLHDIGKVGVPDAVLLKPGRLTPDERTIIETHPAIGADTLLRIENELGDDDFLEMAHDICIAHHERWDGSGYPHKLAGDRIPLSARIVAVADVYDALTSKRPYKDPMPHEQAVGVILESAGSHFDPRVVDAFKECLPLFRDLCRQSRYSQYEKHYHGALQVRPVVAASDND